MSNLAIWEKLGKTDPANTKAFSRSGGFKGTAIKPVYTELKMTEQFGPCGTGWGFSEPTFKVEPGANGEVLVYCWLSLWYVLDGKRSEPVFGVGGDKLVVKFSSGLSSDDEAFKKAFTDAIGNAMKHLGMSADVHMGRFDDSKYVQERQREEAQEHSSPAPAPIDRPLSETLDDIDNAKSLDVLQAIFGAAWKAHNASNARASIKSHYDARKAALTPEPRNLGEHLDNLERLEKSGQSASVPN